MSFTLAALIALPAAVMFFGTLRWNTRARLAAWMICSAVVALSPTLIDVTNQFTATQRLLAALLSITLLVELYDTLQYPDRFIARGFRFYVLHLLNCLWLVIRREPPPRAQATDVAQCALAAILSCAAAAMFLGMFSMNWTFAPFVIEHSLKVATVFALLMPVAALGSAAWRLFIGSAWDAMDAPILARAPAEFWRRWNIPAQQFFAEYVFASAGGTHHPVRATLFTFFVSGAIHEYVFGIATGRFQGWQMLFFLVQGAAVALTSRWRPRGGMAITLAFNLTTSVWFFRSVAAAVPFYTKR